LEENKMAVPIVGIGGTAKELALVKEGKVFGTSCNSPGMNAISAMEVIEDMVAGKKVELRGVVPSPKVTNANLSDCPGDW
jgi:ABC-type sugar transport system substrate-binding protein